MVAEDGEGRESRDHAEQGGEQDIHKQVEGLLRWDPRRKYVSTSPQRQHQSWNLVGGEEIISTF